MQYKEVLERLNKLINYIPSQSQLCEITGVKQSTMSQRVKDNSRFKPEEINKINNHFGINLYTCEVQNNFKHEETIQDTINQIFNSNEKHNYLKEKLNDFGFRLSEIQRKSGLSDKDFAEIIGLYKDEYTELKACKREPNLKILLALKLHFNVSIDWILLGE